MKLFKRKYVFHAYSICYLVYYLKALLPKPIVTFLLTNIPVILNEKDKIFRGTNFTYKLTVARHLNARKLSKLCSLNFSLNLALTVVRQLLIMKP